MGIVVSNQIVILFLINKYAMIRMSSICIVIQLITECALYEMSINISADRSCLLSITARKRYC